MTTKQIVAIIMCIMLVLAVIVTAVVAGRFSPILEMLLGMQDPSAPPSSQDGGGENTGGNNDQTGDSTGGDSDSTGGDSDSTGGDSDSTGGDSDSTGGDSDSTGGDSDPVGGEHTHDYSILKETSEAGCEQIGHKIFACACGETKVESIDALGHTFGVWKQIAPTCVEEGRTERACKRCDYIEKRDVLPKLTEHTWVSGEIRGATCTTAESVQYVCSQTNCIATKEETSGVALGHLLSQWEVTKDPSTGKLGQETRQCLRQGCTQEPETRDTPLFIPEADGIVELKPHEFTIYFAATDVDGNAVVVYQSVVTDESESLSVESFTFEEPNIVRVDDRHALEAGKNLVLDSEGEPKAPETGLG